MIIMRSEKHMMKKKKRKRIFETILSILILLSIVAGLATGYYSSKIKSFLDNISVEEDGDNQETVENTQQLKDLEPFSALILGVDVEQDGASRSDTIIVATINPDSEDIKMVSIPRDTLITLPNGVDEKINAAHSMGGPVLARQMVSSYLDIPIDFYATMDFDGLIELVDAVDGVTVDADFAFTQSNYRDSSDPVRIVEGEQELNGEEALAYARMRKKDPRGDFGRQDRQQEVIIGVLDKLSSFNTVTNLSTILESVQPYLRTNATSGQMLSIASNYSNAVTDVERLTLEGYADYMYFPHYNQEVYIWQPYNESLVEVQDELKEHLGLETSEEEAENASENAYDGNQSSEYGESDSYETNTSESGYGY